MVKLAEIFLKPHTKYINNLTGLTAEPTKLVQLVKMVKLGESV